MDREIEAHFFCRKFPLQFGFFELKTLWFYRHFSGDHFELLESSGDQNLTTFILHFQVFSIFVPPKIQKSPPDGPHKNPDPWDHAQMIEHKILCRITLTRAPEIQIVAFCIFWQTCFFRFFFGNSHGRPRATTGGDERRRAATGGAGRRRAATGDDGRRRAATGGDGQPTIFVTVSAHGYGQKTIVLTVSAHNIF